jgi:hypothetical protein
LINLYIFQLFCLQYGGNLGGFPGGIPGLAGPAGPSGGLEAQLELFSGVGGHITIMLTERAFTAEGCVNANYGKGLTAASASSR